MRLCYRSVLLIGFDGYTKEQGFIYLRLAICTTFDRFSSYSVWPLFAAVFVAGCSSDEGDAEDIASGAAADASGAAAAAADTGTGCSRPIRRSFHRARDRPQHDIYQSPCSMRSDAFRRLTPASEVRWTSRERILPGLT